MRTEEQVVHQYNNYVKIWAKRHDAGAGTAKYYYGAAIALGMCLEKTFPEIQADLDRAKKKFKSEPGR